MLRLCDWELYEEEMGADRWEAAAAADEEEDLPILGSLFCEEVVDGMSAELPREFDPARNFCVVAGIGFVDDGLDTLEVLF